MPHQPRTKERARRLRKAHKSIDEIADATGVSRSTVYSWVKDIRLPGRTGAQAERLRFAQEQMQAKYAKLRQEAYDSIDPAKVLAVPLMRDFTVMYLGEGYRRNRNVVQICNTNPAIMRMAIVAISRLEPEGEPTFKLKLYPDHKPRTEKRFWAEQVGIKPSQIELWADAQKQKPTNRRRSEHGILYASWGDTYLRSKIQALMDAVLADWSTNMFS